MDVVLTPFLLSARTVAQEAGQILTTYLGQLRNIQEKHLEGLVSEADRESEKYIKTRLLDLYPGHQVLGEETGLSSGAEQSSSGFRWIVDPLDGTTNFVHQFPMFCVSLALEIQGELCVGVVEAPKLGLSFWAARGHGAFVNGERMQVSTRTAFRDGLFATGFYSSDQELQRQLELIAITIREARGIRRAGSAALDLSFVAQGVFDVFWEKNLKPWDTAAGVVLVEEAGGRVTDLLGQPYSLQSPSILAGSLALHSEFLKRTSN